MILVVVTSIGVASAAFTWTRLRRLAELKIHHLWLIWLALLTQVVLFGFLGPRIPATVSVFDPSLGTSRWPRRVCGSTADCRVGG